MTPGRPDAVATRVAVLGAETPSGAWVRAALESAKVPGASVDLYGQTRGQAVLSEYGGEARLIQDPDPDDLASHAVVFVCEPGPVADALRSSGQTDRLVVDLGGVVAGGERARLAHVGLADRDVVPDAGVVEAPHAMTLGVARVLGPIAAGPGLRSATVVALRPAGDLGEAGVEELRRQTVHLLSFSEVSTEVFDRQLAFNCIPQMLVREDIAGVDDLVAGQLDSLLDLAPGTSSFHSVFVPVFFGHGFQIRVETRDPVTPDSLAQCLDAARSVEFAADGAAATPVEVDGNDAARVAALGVDGSNGAWMWAALDGAGEAAGHQAVAIARQAGRL